ncbi:MAG: hypothetical protein EOO61_04380 [Hymenobacter sp.]|nr:MAG: hypothetical protein EOO61_04380 [Hymenobacter sp.]
MEDMELIRLYDARIRKIYVEQGLVSLRFKHGYDDPSYAPYGIDLFDKYISAVKQDVPPEPGEDGEIVEVEYFDTFKVIDELIALSDEIIYYTAHTYLYEPHINDPVRDAFRLEGYNSPIYPNYETLASSRFDSYSDIVAEKLYAYWTRIGHLLNRYLPKPLKDNSVDFSRVIDQFTDKMSDYHHNPGYLWLKEFKNTQQRELNEQRAVIVHHTTSRTSFANNHRSKLDYEGHKALMNERRSRPRFFKDHLHLSLVALEKALDLIAELPVPVPRRKVKPVL